MKRAAVIVLLAAGGMLVNVAVAWAAAAWGGGGSRWTVTKPAAGHDAWWEASRPDSVESKPGCVAATWGPAVRMEIVTGVRPGSGASFTFHEDFVAMHVDAPGTHPLDQVLDVRAGWPLAALGAQRWQGEAPAGLFAGSTALAPPAPPAAGAARPGVPLYRAAIPAQRTTAGGLTEERLLPLAPLWPGFAVDSAFYGSLLALLVLGPGAARRAVRRARRRCPACGYPAGASPVCSECGHALAI